MALDEHQRLALIEHVIARRHHVGAGVEQLGQDRLGDAETARGVLAVHHDEIERIALAQLRQMLDHGDASGSADHVSKKQHAHESADRLVTAGYFRGSIQGRGTSRQRPRLRGEAKG